MLKKNCAVIGLLLYACIFICGCQSGSANAGKGKMESYPLILSLDGDQNIATDIYLKCEIVDCGGISYSEYSANENNSYAQALKRFIEAVMAKDNDKMCQLVYQKPNMTDKEKEEFEKNVASKAEAAFGFFNQDSFGKNLSEMLIFNEVKLGQNVYVVIGNKEMERGKNPVRTIRRFEQIGNKLYTDIDQINKTENMLIKIMSQMAKEDSGFKDVSGKKFDYEIPCPGTEGSNQAYFRFNGKKYNLNVMKDKVDEQDEVARLFQRQYELKKISREAVAEVYGGKWKKEYLENLVKNAALYKSMDSGNKANSKNEVDIVIKFILDADPLYIVFYQRGDREGIGSQFIIRDPVDGTLGIRNENVEDYFKQWLDSEEIKAMLYKIILDQQ